MFFTACECQGQWQLVPCAEKRIFLEWIPDEWVPHEDALLDTQFGALQVWFPTMTFMEQQTESPSNKHLLSHCPSELTNCTVVKSFSQTCHSLFNTKSDVTMHVLLSPCRRLIHFVTQICITNNILLGASPGWMPSCHATGRLGGGHKRMQLQLRVSKIRHRTLGTASEAEQFLRITTEGWFCVTWWGTLGTISARMTMFGRPNWLPYQFL